MSARKHVFFFLCPYIWLDTRPGPKWNVFIWLTPWSVFDVNKWVSVVLVDIRPEDSQSGSSYCLIPNQNIYLTQTQSPCKNTYNFVVIQGAGIEPSVLHGQFNGCYDSSTITWLLPFFPPLCLGFNTYFFIVAFQMVALLFDCIHDALHNLPKLNTFHLQDYTHTRGLHEQIH